MCIRDRKDVLAGILMLVLSLSSQAQFYSSGSDPASIHWKQIRTNHFRVVFPQEFENEARRLTAIFEQVYTVGGYSLGHDPQPIDVLVHSHSANSNGFVSWAPKRIELYPSPHQDIFAQDYLTQLAIHEFRHVVQIDLLNKGFTRFLSYLGGQQAIGAVLGLYVPLWFLEGDAVMTETMLSETGRGRLPSFEQEMRAQIIEKGIYSYDKATLGSFKTYVPNHYNMGYHMVAGARHLYGKDIWEQAMMNTGRKSWNLTPFNQGIKQVSGLSKTKLYQDVFNHLKNSWLEKDSTSSPVYKSITMADPSYKNYSYPQFYNDSTILAEISGPGELTRFVSIDLRTGKECKLHVPGTREEAPFSYANQHMVWSELESNIRWENAIHSNVWHYDFQTRKAKRLTHGAKYYAPSLSPNGKTIATVHVSNANDYSIHLIQASDGIVLDTIRTSGYFPITPVWTPDNENLVAILLTSKGKQIAIYNLWYKKWQMLTQPTFSNIRHVTVTNDAIFFSGNWMGIENIYQTDYQGKEIVQLTSSRFGATAATLDSKGKNMVFAEYSADGYQLVSTRLDNYLNKTITLTPSAYQNLFLDKSVKEEAGLPALDSLNTEQYTVNNYSKWNLFHFHSWAPAYIDIENTKVTPGVSLMSQNLLSNTFTTLGYNADQQYTREKFHFNLSYKGWFPELDLDIKYGNDDVFYDAATTTDTFLVESTKKQQFLEVNLVVNIPFNISRGRYGRRIEPYASLGYLHAFDYDTRKKFITQNNGRWYYTGREEDFKDEGYRINTLNYGIFAYNLQKRTTRDIATRWGQIIELKYRHTPSGNYNFGSLIGTHTRLYFPGIGRHHAIRIDNDWHSKQRGDLRGINGQGYRINYGFSDYAKYPRGYQPQYNDDLYSFKGDYMLPLWNPDLSISSALYVKRISMNLFYDYSQSSFKLQEDESLNWRQTTRHFQSVGMEARALTHVFRFVFPFQFGYRYAYLPMEKQHYNEFLFAISFSGYVLNE
jgi:hypothetical protein